MLLVGQAAGQPDPADVVEPPQEAADVEPATPPATQPQPEPGPRPRTLPQEPPPPTSPTPPIQTPPPPATKPRRPSAPPAAAAAEDAGKKQKKKKDWKAMYDEGLVIKSPDGKFMLELTGQVQLRYVFNYREADDGDITTRNDLEARRLKVKASGHVFGDWLNYSVKIARDRDDGSVDLQSAWARIDMSQELSLKIGRYRPPLLREEAVSSKRQLAAERTLVASAFRQPRTAGVGLAYDKKKWRVKGGFFQSTDDLFKNDAWLLTTRAEVLLKGEWKHLKDFTSFPDDNPVVALGAGVLYRYADLPDATDVDRSLVRWTTDISVELGGVHAMAAIVGNHLSEEGSPTRAQFGYVVQGGIFLGRGFEVFARYEGGDADGAAPDLSLVTVGVNGYFNRHRVKFTADVGFGLGEVDDFWATSAAGWRDDDVGVSGQIVARAQFQVLF